MKTNGQQFIQGGNSKERDEAEQSWTGTWKIFSAANQRWNHFI